MSVFWRDLTERALATYVQVVLGFIIAAPMLDVSALRAAGVAGIPAGLSVVKSLLASRFGNGDSASLDPAVGDLS